MTADIDGDGTLDVVRARQQFLGDALEVMLNRGSRFEFGATSIFQYDSIVAVAVYDWDGDGEREIAVVTEARPNLQFFAARDGQFLYEGEVTLSFKPSALVDIAVGNSTERRLLMLPDDPRSLPGRYLSSLYGVGTHVGFEPHVTPVSLEGAGAPEVMIYADGKPDRAAAL